ncbi:MAG: prepilin-type N-terminal cleavage/methylation domain-containing protein [Negativicutes bacterium]|nr:prepilin-type N-terminal cleavage/methylation domain-containing protein [Negativicutes bacterium]
MRKPRSIFSTRPKHGFTLVELLLALAIAAMLFITLADAENSSLRLWRQESLSNEAEQQADAALKRVAHYASFAQSAEILPPTGQSSPILRMSYWDSTDQQNKAVDFYLNQTAQIFYEEIRTASTSGKIQAALYLEEFSAYLVSRHGRQLLRVVFTAATERPFRAEQSFYLRNCLKRTR